jgi:hypothetical protein
VTASLRDETGLVGKIVMVWLLVVALLGVAAVDATSILFTKFRLSDLAVEAANEASTALVQGTTPAEACALAADKVESVDPEARLAKDGCKVDTTTKTVTIKLRKTASTLVAGRVSFTEDFTKVSQAETVGPGEL